MRWLLAALLLFIAAGAQAFWHGSGVAPQTIASTTLSPTAFTAGTGGTIGTASATMSPTSPAFSGTWSLVKSGTIGGQTCYADLSNWFSIDSATGVLTVSASATAATYQICYRATQAGISNSPFDNVVAVTGSSPPPSGDYAFTPLHTYYLAPYASAPAGWGVGRDTNNGTSKATPWASPNHAVVCGDVIIAAPGTYSTNVGYSGNANNAPFHREFGTVSGCPSTSGGIDGTGGVYFAVLLCGGTDLSSAGTTSSCLVFDGGDSSGGFQMEFYGGASNWAVEGFYFNSNGGGRAFGPRMINDAGTTAYKSHHLALINSVVTNSMQAFGSNDGGSATYSGVANAFMDYVAAVGVYAQDAAHNGDYQGGICVAAIDWVSLGNWDTAAGAHTFAYTNYVAHSRSPACATLYDGEAFMTDSPDIHLFNQLDVYSNNIGYDSTRMCINFTAHGATDPTVTFHTYNNTCYGNNMTPGSTSVNGNEAEFYVGGDTNWTLTFYNNIGLPPAASESGVPLYAGIFGGAQLASLKEGTAVGAGLENVFWGMQTGSCVGDPGCAPDSAPIELYYNSNPKVTNTQNTFTNPNFLNTSDLITNRTGTPNCAGFPTTTACVGWDATTTTLTTPSIISDLASQAAGSSPKYSLIAGKGFQLPSTTCLSSTTGTIAAEYPTWLKGIVYLQWNSGTGAITEKAGLVTKPCGL